MRHLFIYLLLLSLPGAVASQSLAPRVLSSGGGDLHNTRFQVSYTIGELTIQTYRSGTTILTQGFQQLFGPGVPLPLTWLSFTGALVNAQAQLEWITAEESNNDHFEVERSSNGLDFEKFTEVKAVGNTTSATTYHATDPSPYHGMTYYRIRQVDLDGKFSYSIIISVRRADGTGWQVYPNPVHDLLVTAIHLSAPRMLILDLYDLSGKLLISRQAMCSAGSNLVEWDTRSLAAGIYLVRCRNADLPTIKIIKK